LTETTETPQEETPTGAPEEEGAEESTDNGNGDDAPAEGDGE